MKDRNGTELVVGDRVRCLDETGREKTGVVEENGIRWATGTPWWPRDFVPRMVAREERRFERIPPEPQRRVTLYGTHALGSDLDFAADAPGCLVAGARMPEPQRAEYRTDVATGAAADGYTVAAQGDARADLTTRFSSDTTVGVAKWIPSKAATTSDVQPFRAIDPERAKTAVRNLLGACEHGNGVCCRCGHGIPEWRAETEVVEIVEARNELTWGPAGIVVLADRHGKTWDVDARVWRRAGVRIEAPIEIVTRVDQHRREVVEVRNTTLPVGSATTIYPASVKGAEALGEWARHVASVVEKHGGNPRDTPDPNALLSVPLNHQPDLDLSPLAALATAVRLPVLVEELRRQWREVNPYGVVDVEPQTKDGKTGHLAWFRIGDRISFPRHLAAVRSEYDVATLVYGVTISLGAKLVAEMVPDPPSEPTPKRSEKSGASTTWACGNAERR